MGGGCRLKVVATIEARMNSSRLPGKVMLPLAGRPMLEQLVRRVNMCATVDKIIIVSSDRPENKVIQDMASRIGVDFFAGSEDDVLDRVLSATEAEAPDVIVQLTGDNPAIPPSVIDEVVGFMKSESYDYVSNYLSHEVILGFNIRCFKRDALKEADRLCQDLKMRSHGGYYIQTRPDLFKLGEVVVDKSITRQDIRLTVDEAEDYEVMQQLFEAFSPHIATFNVKDILLFFDKNPDVARINARIMQKAPGDG